MGSNSMKIKFQGMTDIRTTGCPVCGTTKRGKTYKRREKFYLPSGRVEIFTIDRVSTVSDTDGKWLLENFGCFEVSE